MRAAQHIGSEVERVEANLTRERREYVRIVFTLAWRFCRAGEGGARGWAESARTCIEEAWSRGAVSVDAAAEAFGEVGLWEAWRAFGTAGRDVKASRLALAAAEWSTRRQDGPGHELAFGIGEILSAFDDPADCAAERAAEALEELAKALGIAADTLAGSWGEPAQSAEDGHRVSESLCRLVHAEDALHVAREGARG